MKNMFGVMPGTKYGWPKNLLHWHGHEGILDICATVPIHFVIADGSKTIDGNGLSPPYLSAALSPRRSKCPDGNCASQTNSP
jgi:uncharacterized protein (DUF362 family)